MFESAELGHKIDKKTYRQEAPKLRADLLDVQFDLLQKKEFPIVILISGVDGSGKGETINLLYSWMDPRHISTLAFLEPTDEERERPYMWRYWRALPPKGKIGIFAGSWYSQPIADRINGKMHRSELEMHRSELDQLLDDINRFEAMLVNEGALVLKFWFHLSKDAQKKRLKALEKDPRTAWRVTKASYERLKTYDQLQQVAGHVLRVSNTAHAPWIIVEGTDDAYRSLTVGRIVLDSLRHRLAQQKKPQVPVAPPITRAIDQRNLLSALDLTQQLAKKDFERELAHQQGRLAELVRQPHFKEHALVLVFEGSDAAGKGGSIRRVTAALDARQFQTVPIAAPTEEERAQPYLWRFWRHLPRKGRTVIFDRSWYGR
ncbi:MAG: pap, partial [Proteobacteria bacterium]|nr:pap [Pseudomonadota bacterium]